MSKYKKYLFNSQIHTHKNIKGLLCLVLTLMVTLLSLAPASVLANDLDDGSIAPTPFTAVIASGQLLDWGSIAGAEWELFDDGTVIVEGGGIHWWEDPHYISPWEEYRDDVKKIIFTEPITAGSSLRGLFAGLPYLEAIEGLEHFNTAATTNMGRMFDGTSSLQRIDFPEHWMNSGNVFHLYRKFFGTYALEEITGLQYWDTSGVTSIARLFDGTHSLANLDDISNWDVSNVRDMRTLFRNARSLTSLDLSAWNLASMGLTAGGTPSAGNVHMNELFHGALSLETVNLTGWNTGLVTHMDSMFRNTPNLTTIYGICGWDTSSLHHSVSMFHNASALTSLDLSNWDTANVTHMQSMFSGATSLRELTLGRNFRFASNAALPEPPSEYPYFGQWENVGNGTLFLPESTHEFTSAQLMALDDSDIIADTWIWQRTPIMIYITFYPGANGTLADGAQSMTISVPYRTTLTDYHLPMVNTDSGWTHTGWSPQNPLGFEVTEAITFIAKHTEILTPPETPVLETPGGGGAGTPNIEAPRTAPQSGDNNNLLLWVTISATSAVGILIAGKKHKRSH